MATSAQINPGPLYQRVKDYVIGQINDGTWLPAQQIPSEHELVEMMSASRMTVNRALRELVTEGYLTRIQGVGTFVAEVHGQSHLVEIHNIADEVRARRHDYSCQVITHRKEKVKASVAARLQVPDKAEVFHSVIVHLENNIPIQLEDRYVNLEVVPDYASVDIVAMTPTEFLLKSAPLQQVEHTVQAQTPSARTRKLLQLNDREPCLVVLRRTWSRNRIASFVTLQHPGNRYELKDRFRA